MRIPGYIKTLLILASSIIAFIVINEYTGLEVSRDSVTSVGVIFSIMFTLISNINVRKEKEFELFFKLVQYYDENVEKRDRFADKVGTRMGFTHLKGLAEKGTRPRGDVYELLLSEISCNNILNEMCRMAFKNEKVKFILINGYKAEMYRYFYETDSIHAIEATETQEFRFFPQLHHPEYEHIRTFVMEVFFKDHKKKVKRKAKVAE